MTSIKALIILVHTIHLNSWSLAASWACACISINPSHFSVAVLTNLPELLYLLYWFLCGQACWIAWPLNSFPAWTFTLWDPMIPWDSWDWWPWSIVFPIVYHACNWLVWCCCPYYQLRFIKYKRLNQHGAYDSESIIVLGHDRLPGTNSRHGQKQDQTCLEKLGQEWSTGQHNQKQIPCFENFCCDSLYENPMRPQWMVHFSKEDLYLHFPRAWSAIQVWPI